MANSRYTVLVIDDAPKILDIVKYFLESEGFIVKTCADPREGIKTAQEGGINLILLDIMMPIMDGYKVYEVLKSDATTKEIPVIMLTARAVIMNTPKEFFYGLYGFLAKPFTKQQLVGMVRDILKLTLSEDVKRAKQKDPKSKEENT